MNSTSLYRELRDGRLFYILTDKPHETRLIFEVRQQKRIGTTVAIFEPEYTGQLKSIPVVSVKDAIIPVSPGIIRQHLRPFIAEYAEDTLPQTLYVQHRPQLDPCQRFC